MIPTARPERAPERPRHPVARLLRWFFTQPWEAIAREGEVERRALGERFDWWPFFVLVTAALVLLFQDYFGDRDTFGRLFPSLQRTHYGTLYAFAWWSGTKVFGYVLVPIVVYRALRFPAREWGLRLHPSSLGVYAVLFAAVLPVVVIASYTAPFQHTYPFYKTAVRSWFDLCAWEVIYALQFLALEFFFRGFLLFPLRRALGANAIFVAAVPYCMIHFQKPVAECAGAIFAGVLLGTLALRTRSIWGGVLLHVAVAWSMDLLALWHTVGFPDPGRYVGR